MGGSDSEDSKKPKKKRKKERKSRSKSRSKSQPRPVSPFSAKMAPGESGVPAGGVMNMPEEHQPSSQPAMNLPLPDLRQDIERLKSQRSQEESSGDKTTPAKTVAPGFPMIDLTKPPPGWQPPVMAHAQMNDKEYDEKVRRSLRSSSRHRRRSKRSRSKSGDRKRRSKSRSKSKTKKDKSRSKSKEKEKILIEDDDFNKKLKDHLSSSQKRKSKSRSKDRRRSKSKSRDRKRSRSRSKERKSSRRSRSREHKSRRHSSRSKSRDRKHEKDKEHENKDGEKDKEENKSKVPSGSGMWIPTGEDSIVDGVKEAINKIEKKERRRSGEDRKSKSDDKPTAQNIEYEIKYDKRTGMYTRVPKEQPKKPEAE